MDTFPAFISRVQALDRPRILELGAARSNVHVSTLHKEHFPNASEYHGTDIKFTEDVDFLADVHRLSDVTGRDAYDAIITCSGFEHFKYPHLAALEISKVLRPGGFVFVQTHSTFPLHAYPYDYFRFSTEALAGAFGTKNGVTVLGAEYVFPCTISSERIGGKHPGWLNVNLLGQKTGVTPTEYVYEFDCEV